MYEWRKISDQERWDIVKARRQQNRPHHAPPKFENLAGLVILTASCFEHKAHMENFDRRVDFSISILTLMDQLSVEVHAWIILPNHYHLLVDFPLPTDIRPIMGKLHGRTSRKWNLEDGAVGRKVWYHGFERPIRSRSHYYRSLNYIHHNAVKHGYCKRWTEWKTSSANKFIKEVGYERALDIWRSFPIDTYGSSIEA